MLDKKKTLYIARHYKFYNDKRFNPSKKIKQLQTHKCLSTKSQRKSKMTEWKRETGNLVIIAGVFNAWLSMVITRQKVNKKNQKLEQHYKPTRHNRYLHHTLLNSKTYVLLKSHGSFSRTDHMFHHKTSPNNFKRIKIIQNTFSNHNEMKLEANNRREFGKFNKYIKITQHILK